MTQDDREEIARHYAQQCLKSKHPDEASSNQLYATVLSLQYRLRAPRSEWPAWAQYIYLRFAALRRRSASTPHKDAAPNT